MWKDDCIIDTEGETDREIYIGFLKKENPGKIL